MNRSWLTRALHALLAVSVTHQLLVSLAMEEPEEGEAESLLFELHETVGLVTLGVIVAFWLWTLVRRGETPLAALFPWLSPTRLRELAADVEAAEEVHEAFGTLAWAYLVGHAGMAVLHRLAGHGEIAAMLSLRPGGR